ncbi:MAG: M61 family metallopeptidase [Planctomycetes bacterium]|nr:M61 family metallopeptidase [Planctomycetota bacterium]
MAPIEFRIDARRAHLRELSVSLEFDTAPGTSGGAPREQIVFLPTWTPGSYLIREFARHLSRVEALDAASGRSLACRKVTKNRFAISLASDTRRVRLDYRVYAHELTVRTADATADHAFWNHACVLLWPVDDQDRGARIGVHAPPGWRLACSLPHDPLPDASSSTDGLLATLVARDIDEAMDAPCLIGRFERIEWSVGGVPHAIALDDLAGVSPPPGLVADLTAIVERAKELFGGSLPYESYLFLCLFAADGHGGLEHATSTTLLASRTAWRTPKGYRDFLGLAAHELFHAWNVKRMRPREFWRYDYENENYTDLLWLIEGWTAYYDDLLCQRAGLMTRGDYLAIVAKNVNAMLSNPGRLQASLAESSFDAWIRLYRPDENTRNSSQNYYGNGSVAALCLDLSVRAASEGRVALDHVLRELYATTFGRGRGYTLEDVQAALARLADDAAVATLTSLVSRDLDPDLAAMFAPFGIRVVVKDSDRPWLGISFDTGGTRIASVTRGSPAHAAGLSPGDEVLAVQSLRVDAGRWQEVVDATVVVGQPVEVLLARRGVVAKCVVTPARGPGTVSLEIEQNQDAGKRALLDGWLTADRETASPAKN